MIYLFDINDFSRNDSFNAEPESLTYTSHSLYWYCSGNSGFQGISCISGTLISPPFTNIPCYMGVYFGRHPIFGHHNFANRGRVTYDIPLHTKPILGFTIVLLISLQLDAFNRCPDEWSVMAWRFLHDSQYLKHWSISGSGPKNVPVKLM